MKKLLFSLGAAVTLVAVAPAIAAPAQNRPDNYGYPKGHRVTPDERKRWEAAHRYDDNFGFPKNHKVTPQERKRWEDAHRKDQHNDRPGDRH